MLDVVANRQATHHDVAEQVGPESARRRHHPAHAQRGADLLGVAAPAWSGPDDLLEGDDVRSDPLKHRRDSERQDPSVESTRPVDVVSHDPKVDLETTAR